MSPLMFAVFMFSGGTAYDFSFTYIAGGRLTRVMHGPMQRFVHEERKKEVQYSVSRINAFIKSYTKL